MKKWLTAVWIAVTLVLTATTAYAEGERIAYPVEDLGFAISLPADWTVLTRQTPKDDPIWRELDTTYRQAMKSFKGMNLYLTASHQPIEMNVMMIPDRDTYDYNLYRDEDLQAIIDHTVTETAQQEGLNISYSGGGLYQHAQGKFLLLEGYRTDLDAYLRQYGTVINGMSISVIFGVYGQPVTEEREELFQQIIDSVTFDQVSTAPDSAVEHAQAFQERLAAGTAFQQPEEKSGGNWLFYGIGFALIGYGLYVFVRKRKQ